MHTVKPVRKSKSLAPMLAALLVLQGICLPTIAQAADPARQLTLEEKMNRRYPQPVRVGDLIGLPVLDDDDSTIGYVRDVVRTKTGKIQLVVPYGHWFGWVRLGGPFDWDRRLVGVPIETVAILGRQIDALDMPPEAFDAAPPFKPQDVTPIGRDETIKIALGRR